MPGYTVYSRGSCTTWFAEHVRLFAGVGWRPREWNLSLPYVSLMSSLFLTLSVLSLFPRVTANSGTTLFVFKRHFHFFLLVPA